MPVWLKSGSVTLQWNKRELCLIRNVIKGLTLVRLDIRMPDRLATRGRGHPSLCRRHWRVTKHKRGQPSSRQCLRRSSVHSHQCKLFDAADWIIYKNRVSYFFAYAVNYIQPSCGKKSAMLQ